MEDPLRIYEAEPRVIAVPGRAWDRGSLHYDNLFTALSTHLCHGLANDGQTLVDPVTMGSK